ncbi:MAG: response regulator [Gemmatimonadetes bacterium]|nr:response regulator [Gemmatimonadota bacterium]MBK6778260.1 response regulator [Gemmatimonadota bacterium]MBK7349430.1 response regulator [Gemmatimonadota bacterium]MBK7784060.1 response regulator [Gemmatimonadota bacterium]MBK7924989.1 response regulator [Gemmatimonadota bacterium]
MVRPLPAAAPPTAPAPEAPAAPDSPALLDGIQRDKLSLIGHMASSIAHELSNPLATIVASTQAILSFWPRGGGPPGAREVAGAPADWTPSGVPLRQLREDLELILAEARRAGDIVHGLLASARQDPPEWRIVSLADVVRRTVGLCRHHLKLHNVTLQAPYFDPHEGYPLWSRIRGDANQLQQVLLNLVINAQQAITAHRGFGTVRITLAPDGPDRILLTVEDDGPGVPSTQQEAIFRPFYTTKPRGQGTGLGLSVSAEIVRAHGGSIAVTAHTSGGAAFRLGLPSLAASDRSLGTAPGTPDRPEVTTLSLPEPPAPLVTGEQQRILLVDDESGIRRSVGRYLRRAGYQVTDVPSAQAALNALSTARYDVIVSDLRMPGLSGEEFFRRLEREHPEMRRRIIFTSGDMLRDETQDFLHTAGCPALQKPYELGELVQLIGSLLPAPATRASA